MASRAQLRSAANALGSHVQKAADRAIDDPVALERAARIIRTALARNRLTLADLEPGPDPRPALGRNPERPTATLPHTVGSGPAGDPEPLPETASTGSTQPDAS